MRSLNIRCAALLALGIMSQQAYSATSFGRAYQFGFRNGNLIRNWSFENPADNWYDEASVSARFLAKQDGITAVSGSYVAKYSGSNSTGSAVRKLGSEFMPIEAGVSYNLSLFARTSSTLAGTRPVVVFYDKWAGTAMPTPFTGANYPTNVGWTFLTYAFIAPAGANFAQLVLAEMATGQNGTVYVDDVVLETGGPSASNRDSISEAVALFNDFGQTVQSHQKIAGGGNSARKHLVGGMKSDYQMRPTRSYLPYVRTGSPDFDAGFEANSKTFNNGTNGKETLGEFPYSSSIYTDVLASPLDRSFMPGTAWNPSDQSKRISSGSYFTASLTAPANVEQVANDAAERPYLYSWARDVEGRYSLSWSNSLGQVIQTAVMPNTTWIYTRYQYFPNGQLKKVLQNSDIPDNEAAQDYREVTNYNALGEITSIYAKDRGLRKFWYNRLGALRFTRHESQAANEYDYTGYDLNDRPISMGTQVLPNFNAATVEERNSASTVKTEHRGIIYDNLSQFQARTGIILSDIMPGKTLGVNGDGRVVCEYNHNKGIDLASLAAKDKFVATFYNYNGFGEITESYKYIGAVKDPAKRIHMVNYYYDNHHRMYQTIMSDNAATPYTSFQKYGYDELGRVNKVSGAAGKFYSSYQYYDWGGLKSVTMGGSGNSYTGTRIDFSYNAQGWTKEIKAVRQATNEVVFQQYLGYENQAVTTPNLPALAQTKYDGSIAQQLVKFAKDVESASPIRVVNYKYDNGNRMTEADARKNSGVSPLDANQQIIFGSLQWTDTEDMDSRFSFDDKGRIATNQSGVASADKATYYYQGESYKLDRVTGKLGGNKPRDASVAGGFVYDARGRMVGDSSKKMSVRYGWDDMPVEFAMDNGDSLFSELNFYDAGGSRVSRLFVKTERMVWVPISNGDITFFVRGFKNTADVSAKQVMAIAEVNLLSIGDRRWTEIYGSAGEILATSGKSGVFGVSGQIGELNTDGTYRFFVKNHQGSVMRTVGDNGEYLDAAGSVTDFMAYGSQAKLKSGSTEQVQSFTGKELEETFGLYAFGARWYDPELAIWMSPDPAEEYYNPYAYVGGNVPNLIDPWGLSSCSETEVTEECTKDALGLPDRSVTLDRGDAVTTGILLAAGPLALGAMYFGGVFDGPTGSIYRPAPQPPQADASTVMKQYYRPLEDPYKGLDAFGKAIKSDAIFQGIIYEPWGMTLSQAQMAFTVSGVVGAGGSMIFLGKQAFGVLGRRILAKEILKKGGGRAVSHEAVGTISADAVSVTEISGAESALNGAQLSKHLAQLEKYGEAGFKELENGSIQYFGKIRPANNPGEMIGARVMREWNPASNTTKTWMETLDQSGMVRIIRPETGGEKIHYMYDALGNFIGAY